MFHKDYHLKKPSIYLYFGIPYFSHELNNLNKLYFLNDQKYLYYYYLYILYYLYLNSQYYHHLYPLFSLFLFYYWKKYILNIRRNSRFYLEKNYR